jgi:deoxyribonuclease V
MKPLHAWNVDVGAALRIQEKLRGLITLENGFPGVTAVGGADVSYSAGNLMVAAVLIFSYPDLKLLDSGMAAGRISFPYIPGLLAFREGPILLKAFETLKMKPDVMIFEGQGIAHPRGIGMASHLGLWLDVPSIGCTKSPLLKTEITVGRSKGEHQPVLRDGSEVGAIVRTKKDVKPLFVSPGHRIELPTSVRIILETCGTVRMPEPLRRADKVSRMALKAAVDLE